MQQIDSRPLAIVPCRLGSKGVPLKNIKSLAGLSPVARAVRVAKDAGCYVVVTSEAPVRQQCEWGCNADAYHRRPLELATDEAPMIGVIHDVLACYEGDPIVLVQCTQPLRQPKHLIAAITLLQESQANSVVSVVELPLAHSPDYALRISGTGELVGWETDIDCQPTRRQEASRAYIRDGTVYAFWRKTVTQYGTLYGGDVRPLIVPASETQSLDTCFDWAEAERRLRERDPHH